MVASLRSDQGEEEDLLDNENKCSFKLVLGATLAPTCLFRLEVLVQQIERPLIGHCRSHDGKHTFSGLVMRCLGDGDARTRTFPYLADFAAAATNDASNHVGRDTDVLREDFLAFFCWSSHAAT